LLSKTLFVKASANMIAAIWGKSKKISWFVNPQDEMNDLWLYQCHFLLDDATAIKFTL
jgi:hypothetical protein